MRKIKLLVMLMGALTLQSCVKYRIRIVEHGSMKYYTPEKRILYTWEELKPFYGNDLESAKRTIDQDRNRNIENRIYFKY